MTTMANDVRELEAQHVLQTYRRQPVVFERGEGVWLFDDAGNRYLDFLSGIGVASLGHAHPGLARAIARQSETLLHTSNLYFHPLQGELATRLSVKTGLERAFFCNSGTEAIEACLKFARRFWHTAGVADRTKFVAFDHAFHGRTMGSLSVTWDEHYRAPFAPLVPGVTFAIASDPASLASLVDEHTAAIIVEPIQGEGGVRPVPPALAAAIAEACRRTGALLIADEVQSGSGRTGTFLYSGTAGLAPDLIALGKALGAGVPVGAAMVSGKVATAISAGDHGTTYGGNLLSTRAALYVLDELDKLAPHIKDAGALFEQKLLTLQKQHKVITSVRGAGLMRGLELAIDAAPVIEAALKAGLLVNRTAERVVRMLPPLTVTAAEIEEATRILDGALRSVSVEEVKA